MKTAKTKATKPAAKPTKEKAPVIFKTVKKYEGDNKRAEAQKFIPAKGASLETILKASKMERNKLRRYLRGLVRHGCVKKIAA